MPDQPTLRECRKNLASIADCLDSRLKNVPLAQTRINNALSRFNHEALERDEKIRKAAEDLAEAVEELGLGHATNCSYSKDECDCGIGDLHNALACYRREAGG